MFEEIDRAIEQAEALTQNTDPAIRVLATNQLSQLERERKEQYRLEWLRRYNRECERVGGGLRALIHPGPAEIEHRARNGERPPEES